MIGLLVLFGFVGLVYFVAFSHLLFEDCVTKASIDNYEKWKQNNRDASWQVKFDYQDETNKKP